MRELSLLGKVLFFCFPPKHITVFTCDILIDFLSFTDRSFKYISCNFFAKSDLKVVGWATKLSTPFAKSEKYFVPLTVHMLPLQRLEYNWPRGETRISKPVTKWPCSPVYSVQYSWLTGHSDSTMVHSCSGNIRIGGTGASDRDKEIQSLSLYYQSCYQSCL